jgi:MoaA/NifB/PqqE/SkfB family radical SAM enzyme
MDQLDQTTETSRYGPRRLTVELTNICNLHCSYCLRDEDALYHSPANFLSVDLLARVLQGAREVLEIEQVMFTGGEATLHPDFGGIIAAVAAHDLKCSFVTNGWHFERIWPLVAEYRETITHVAFSLDGITRESHDHWRGEGSFERLVQAFSRCWANSFPFIMKMGLRRDTIPDLERVALFAARMGAAGLSFAHIMPTSDEIGNASALTLEERAEAEREIALLARVFKMSIGIDVGYYNTEPAAPCSALAGTSCNLDYLGHLSLCCNLSGFRGGTGKDDVVADLNREEFATAFDRLQNLAAAQLEKRTQALTRLKAEGTRPDLMSGSPCLFCLHTLGKTPWTVLSLAATGTALPVLRDVN